MKRRKVLILSLLILVSAIVALGTPTQYFAMGLNRFSSYEELKQFLQNRRLQYYSPYGLQSLSYKRLSDVQAFSVPEYSMTNVQVEGVDEADFVKTDGEYIYTISNQTVVIVKAYPPEESAVLSRITVDGTLRQMFINEGRLVIFHENSTQTTISIYDVSQPENPVITREFAMNGSYFSSRMIGDFVYAIIREPAWINEGEVNLPTIRSKNFNKTIEAEEIYYSDIPDYNHAFTTIVAVSAHEDTLEPTYTSILTGYATTIYVSLENIYLAVPYGGETLLHRIHVENSEITYAADGEVEGSVLNQFSMDEYNGYFRIVTQPNMLITSLQVLKPQVARSNWFSSASSANRLYVLNMNLDVVGELGNIAPGENLHSVRFMGDLCYLVTFQKIDPFFVIDLSNPENPNVLGELKISGFSDYLHPYDDSHVIGVGKETVPGGETFSWFQGVKISLFDIADASTPLELAKYVIGDRGTDTPVLRDHKAFLFDRERNLLVLPVAVAEVDETQYPNGVPPNAYGELVWQGVYVFTVSLDLEEKITLKGTITHTENGDATDSTYHITRALYIGEYLYTISPSTVKVNLLADLSEVKELKLTE